MKIVILKLAFHPNWNTFIEHLNSDSDCFYFTKGNQTTLVENLFSQEDNSSYDILILQTDKDESDLKKIRNAWYAKARDSGVESNLSIENAVKLDDPTKDDLVSIIESESEIIDNDKYLFVEEISSEKFYDKINKFNFKEREYGTGNFNILKKSDLNESILEYEDNLFPLAQRSIDSKRALGYSEPDNRTEYQKDKDKIINSKAFRRLVDKAQVYNTEKGDHFRNRLTHTLEVNKIAKTMARSLKLNEDLTEAIALAHDIGHTPFGHQGERTIARLIQEKDNTNNRNGYYGGFKHNYQGVRIVNYLEEKFLEHPGLDLSYQVIEGMLKHTKTTGDYQIDNYLIIGDKSNLYLDYSHSITLEGQIVAMADEIAQISHDLDDGIANGLVEIEELKERLETKNFSPLVEKIEDINRNFSEREKESEKDPYKRQYIDGRDILRASVVPVVVDYLIKKVVSDSQKNIINYYQSHGESVDIIEDILIKIDKSINLKLFSNVIMSNVINSYEVNFFDGKSTLIIEELFNEYYNNPRLLPDNTIDRIIREIQVLTRNYTNLRRGSIDKIKEEIKILKGKNKNGNQELIKRKEKIYIRGIADFIAGMTDNFAREQYKKLFQV